MVISNVKNLFACKSV